MIKKVATVVSLALIATGLAVLRTEESLFVIYMPIFLLGFGIAEATFKPLCVRLKMTDRVWQRWSCRAAYYLLWSGFILFVLMMGMSYV